MWTKFVDKEICWNCICAMTDTNFELEMLQEPTVLFPCERYLNFRVLSGEGKKFLQHVQLSWT
jgi:hypothetical protein